MIARAGHPVAVAGARHRRRRFEPRSLVFVLSFLAVAKPCGPAEAAGERQADVVDRDFADRLAAVEAKASGIRDLSADFVETKKTILLREPLSSSGTVVASGGRTKWMTREPHTSWLCTTAEHVTIYFPNEKRAERYPVDVRLRPLLISPVPQTARLRESFDVEQIETDDSARTAGTTSDALRLALRPKTAELRELVERIEVDIDERRGVASRVQIFDADGDVTTIEFRNVRINGGASDEDMDCTLPPGTDVADFSDEGARRP